MSGQRMWLHPDSRDAEPPHPPTPSLGGGLLISLLLEAATSDLKLLFFHFSPDSSSSNRFDVKLCETSSFSLNITLIMKVLIRRRHAEEGWKIVTDVVMMDFCNSDVVGQTGSRKKPLWFYLETNWREEKQWSVRCSLIISSERTYEAAVILKVVPLLQLGPLMYSLNMVLND